MIEKHSELLSVLEGILIILLIALTVFTGVIIRNKLEQGRHIGKEENTITVSGQGKVYVKPDLSVVNFSVITEKDTVDQALQVNKEKMNRVIAHLKDQGIEKKDLKTTIFDLQPRYEWHQEETSRKEGKRKLVGYEVTQELQVKIRELDTVGEVIQEATDAGANKVGNIQFTLENREEFKKKARKKAIEQAKSKAEEISSQLEVELVKIVNFSEDFYTPRPYSGVVKERAAGGAPEVEPGQNKVEVNLSITYKID